MSKDFAGDETQGIASCASWSSDGEHIAFFATLGSVGKSGFARKSTFDLYLYSIKTGKAESQLSGMYDPANIQWSPDGRSIVFTARESHQSFYSLWLFRPDSKKLTLIATGYLNSIVWSPDSKKIAVVWCTDLNCTHSEVRSYTLDVLE